MDLHINEDYVMLNQRLQHEILSGKIDKKQTVYYTMKNDLINDYYAPIIDYYFPDDAIEEPVDTVKAGEVVAEMEEMNEIM